MKRTVDVYLDGDLLISYPINYGSVGAPVTDDDFIELARQNLREDGYSAEAIATAEFVVRQADDGVP